MSTDLSHAPSAIGPGSTFWLQYPSGRKEEFCMGSANDPKTEPKTIGEHSCWGIKLCGKTVGDQAVLGVEECNEVTATIVSIN